MARDVLVVEERDDPRHGLVAEEEQQKRWQRQEERLVAAPERQEEEELHLKEVANTTSWKISKEALACMMEALYLVAPKTEALGCKRVDLQVADLGLEAKK